MQKHMSFLLDLVLLVIGVGLVLAGVFLLSVPAGLIVSGGVVVAGAYVRRALEVMHEVS